MKVFSFLFLGISTIAALAANALVIDDAGISTVSQKQQPPQQMPQLSQQTIHNLSLQHAELTHAEARELAAQLSMQLIDSLYEMRALSEQKPNNSVNRAKGDDDDGGGDSDSDDSTTKLLNKAASALRPIVKEFANVVSSALPAGPQRQLIKATANAVDSLMPLILKYALGI
ncbi:hypothetical protein J3B02_004130 [Coemansia erecta]|uniref:Uncharacterized protein n=1 Tax=Coemansia asiatica TaxID=1052880 RepID=A0A9W8CLI7_9FUNG|nr:hypothetical protein LPJ64_001967 [Coemansia asiatica]KAJ2847589.1 hypothetical protein J3B02_004130 [Coemansia erecta]